MTFDCVAGTQVVSGFKRPKTGRFFLGKATVIRRICLLEQPNRTANSHIEVEESVESLYPLSAA